MFFMDRYFKYQFIGYVLFLNDGFLKILPLCQYFYTKIVYYYARLIYSLHHF